MKTLTRPRGLRDTHAKTQDEYFHGVRTVPYDLVKELAIALVAMLAVIGVLSIFLSSPDEHPVTIKSWSTADPVDFVTTATGELAGTTITAQYGPPYNDQTGAVQSIGPLAPQAWFGVHQPVDAANDFVLNPLKIHAAGDSTLSSALDQYSGADDKTRQGWLDAYTKALDKATADSSGGVSVADGDYGPLPVMMASLLGLAQAGGLDGLLLSQGGFYQTDYTRPLLFMGDGGYLAGLAGDQHLLGTQWGMMNETGTYPGQTWLWLYTFWYQVPPFSGAANADLGVVLMMTVLSALLMLIPFIPGLRDLPRLIPIHRFIWRR